MQAAAIVVFFNELAQMAAQVFQIPIAVAVDFLLLERFDEALALGVVVRVSRSAHTGRHVVMG
jgi:hypothetical protein